MKKKQEKQVRKSSARHASQSPHIITAEDRTIILWLYAQGFHQRRIGALFDVNQGRISKAVTESKLFSEKEMKKRREDEN